MPTWYLVRHGQTEWNAARRMQGRQDSSLTVEGRDHARMSGRLLAQLGIDAVYASPLGRVRQTLELMSEHIAMAPVFDERLVEWSSGEWSGELYADLAAKWPADWAAWQADQHGHRPPGGENFVDLAERAASFLADVAAPREARIAIVAHGFMNRALAGRLLNLAPAEIIAIRQSNDTLIRVHAPHGEGVAADHFVAGDGPIAGLPGAPAVQVA